MFSLFALFAFEIREDADDATPLVRHKLVFVARARSLQKLADAGFREVICPIEHPLFPHRDHVVRVAAVCGRDAGRAAVVYGTIVQPTDQKRLGAHESKSHHLRRS